MILSDSEKVRLYLLSFPYSGIRECERWNHSHWLCRTGTLLNA